MDHTHPNTAEHQLSITSNTTLTDIIPAGYLLELLLIEETTGNDFNLDIGTTDGGTEIIDGIDIIGSNNITGNDTTVLVLNKYF